MTDTRQIAVDIMAYSKAHENDALAELVGQLVELLNLGESALECVANLNDRGLIVGTSSDDHTQEVDEILEHPLAPWNQP